MARVLSLFRYTLYALFIVLGIYCYLLVIPDGSTKIVNKDLPGEFDIDEASERNLVPVPVGLDSQKAIDTPSEAENDIAEVVARTCSCERSERPRLFILDCHARLGNQLFQLASSYALARATNHTPIMVPSIQDNYYDQVHGYFPNLRICQEFHPPLTPVVSETAYATYDETLYHKIPPSNTTLSAFLQSWKYFHSYKREIQHLFAVDPIASAKAQRELAGIAATLRRHMSNDSSARGDNWDNITYIGLHIRRQDKLLKLRYDAGHRVPNMTYIEHALGHFRSRYPQAQFIVCSDDLDWCKENIQGPDIHFPVGRRRVLADLALLMHCNHTIMTVGTFAWWPAYLSGGEAVYYAHPFDEQSRLYKGLQPQDFYLPQWTPLE